MAIAPFSDSILVGDKRTPHRILTWLGSTRKLGSSYPLSPKGDSLSIPLSASCLFYTYCKTLHTPSRFMAWNPFAISAR